MIQSDLVRQVNEIRELLESPSKLSAKAIAACRAVGNDLADRCYFNLGWRMANPDKQLRGPASTEEIAKDLAVLLDLLRSEQKPSRGKGRPEEPLDRTYMEAVILVRTLGAENDYALKKDIVLRCLKDGLLKDRVRFINGERKTTSTEAHIKKIDRELEKLATQRAGKTKNVLDFRPKKPARQKLRLN